jgi:hypothetical protein
MNAKAQPRLDLVPISFTTLARDSVPPVVVEDVP